jgi:hypothetical protein
MRSKRTPVRMRRAGCSAIGFAIGAIGALCFCPAAVAGEASLPNLAEPATLSKFGNANHELMVRAHTQTDTNCVAVGTPDLHLDASPRHGVLCLRPADDVPIVLASDRARPCLGKRVSGVRIYYLPRRGYTGADTFRYTALFSNRYRYTRDVNLIIVPDVPPSPGAVQADVSGTADDAPQSPGPIPLCTALAS